MIILAGTQNQNLTQNQAIKQPIYYRKAEKWNLQEPTEFNSKEQTIHTWISVDSEFQTHMNKQNQLITVQLNDVIWEHPSLAHGKTTISETHSAISEYLGFEERDTDYPKEKDKRLIVELGLFFSPTDIFALFNKYLTRKNILKQLDQDNRLKTLIKGKVFKYAIWTGLKLINKEGIERHLFIRIHDACALMGSMSLKKLAESLNIQMSNKDILSEKDKKEMLRTYREKPVDFIKYAKSDSQVIQPLFQRYQELWNGICDDLGIEKFMPGYTVGTNTAKISEKIIIRNLSKDVKISEKEIVGRISNQLKYKGKPVKNYREIVISLNQEATSKDLAADLKYTSQLLAMVDGGRCKNERPMDVKAHGLLADIDISGCYGNGLLNQIYPVGIPTILKFRKEQSDKQLTLNQFMKSNIFKDLFPGLWFARVSTTELLTFDQDLIISKIPPDKIVAASSDGLEQTDSKKILGTFILLTREIKTAVINHDLLQILQDCSSNIELSELKEKICIDALIYYPSSKKCISIDDWSQSFSKTDNGVTSSIVPESINEKDERSRHWIEVPMGKDWIDVLLGLRQNADKDSTKNAGLKLIINATYGVQASSYFDIGNVVVANNITARARGFAWMMAKAFGMYQTITDGGIFNLNTVNHWKDKRPGLHTLTHINNTKSLKTKTISRITTIPLGGKEWKLVNRDKEETTVSRGDENIRGKQNCWPEIDKLIWIHLKEFFFGSNIDILNKVGTQITGYDYQNQKALSQNIEGLFQIETKDLYKEASFQSQANYRLVGTDDRVSVKARGYEVEKQVYLDQAGEIPSSIVPIIDCMEHIARGEHIPHYSPIYTPNVLKVKTWKSSARFDEMALLPGDTISKMSFLRPISISMFRFRTWKQWEWWSKKHNKLKKDKGYGIEQFYIDQQTGNVNYEEAIKKTQESIDAGVMSMKNRRSERNQNHPNLSMVESTTTGGLGFVDETDEQIPAQDLID